MVQDLKVITVGLRAAAQKFPHCGFLKLAHEEEDVLSGWAPVQKKPKSTEKETQSNPAAEDQVVVKEKPICTYGRRNYPNAVCKYLRPEDEDRGFKGELFIILCQGNTNRNGTRAVYASDDTGCRSTEMRN